LENYDKNVSLKISGIFLSLTALSVLLPIIGLGLSTVRYLLLAGGFGAFFHQWLATNVPPMIDNVKLYVKSFKFKNAEVE
jgi:hypothetical protein